MRIGLPIILCCLIVGLSVQLKAHPSYGLIVTKENIIYFADVLHNEGTIWKIETDGRLSPVLTGEHSHFLFLDAQETIWGTHYGNDYALWKLNNRDQKEIIIPPTPDRTQFSGGNFVVDQEGNIYFDSDNQVFIRTIKGPARIFHSHRFARIASLQLDQHDNLYVVDNNAQEGSVIKITPHGALTVVANHLLERQVENPPFGSQDMNLLFAVFVDAQGNVFVANIGSRLITRIDVNGTQSHIYQSTAPWYPVAYCERDGIAYVMETGVTPDNKGNTGPRILKIENGNETVLADTDHLNSTQHEVASVLPADIQTPIKRDPGRGVWYLLLACVLFGSFVIFKRMIKNRRVLMI